MTAPQPHLKPIGDVDAHDTLYRRLATLQPCKVLDAPCGRGACSEFLQQRGFEVHAADIDAGLFKLEGVPFTVANLNRALPFEDASFDLVVCANALHRLANPGGAIREFRRILRPGGRLAINANNYANLVSRLRFLISGSMDSRVNDGVCFQTIEEPEAHLRSYLLYPQIANMLGAAGFDVVAVEAAAVRREHCLLRPVSWLIRQATHLVPRSRREADHIAVTASNAVLGGGRYIYIEALRGA